MNSNNLIVGKPTITRYGIGDCEMLERPAGTWITINELHVLLDWIADHDDRDVMLAKIEMIRKETL